MRISSFDIFDTCVVRKCGNAKNLFDVLSYRVFSGKVSTERRLEFITQRLSTDESSTFGHLYNSFDYKNPLLLSKEDIMQKELECEREMMVPVMEMLKEVNIRRNHGDHIIFISDMYLPTDFLKQAMSEMGFLKEQDTIYVSGDCSYTKRDGSLYQWIKKEEHIEYSNWHHYGDNPVSDVQQPKKFGIITHHIEHKFLPYEEIWKSNSNNIIFHTGDIMAGVCRSILLSSTPHPHNAFALDIAAPISVTFTFRVLVDAQKRGIKKLFFCSRDCYALYHVAKKLIKVVPNVEVYYFYTSRDALYNSTEENLMTHLSNIGLADKNNQVGVVDMRTTGKSLQYLNSILERNNFNTVFGYYLEMYCSSFFAKDVPSYYCEINRLYNAIFEHHYPILEKFLSLCPEKKTIEYTRYGVIMEENDENEDFYIHNIEKLSIINLDLLCRFADYFVETELYRYCTEIFLSLVIPTIKLFFREPRKIYLLSLRQFNFKSPKGNWLPYIEEMETGVNFQIAKNAQNSNIRFIRRVMKLIMRVRRIKPIPNEVWWPEGTRIYNTR